MAHISFCYKQECAELPLSLIDLLETNANMLHREVREKLFQAIILLRNKDMIDPVLVIKLCFKLLSLTQDKTLRTSLGDYLFNDIKTINQKSQNHALNHRVQALLFNIVKEVGDR